MRFKVSFLIKKSWLSTQIYNTAGSEPSVVPFGATVCENSLLNTNHMAWIKFYSHLVNSYTYSSHSNKRHDTKK